MERRENDAKGTLSAYFSAHFNTLGEALEFLSLQAGDVSATSLSESLGEFIAATRQRTNSPRPGFPDNHPIQRPAEESIERWYKGTLRPSRPFFRLIKDYFKKSLGASTFDRIEADLNRLFLEAGRERRAQNAGRAAPKHAAIQQALSKLAAFERRWGNTPGDKLWADPARVKDWMDTIQTAEDAAGQAKDCDAIAGIAAGLFHLDHWNDGHAAARKLAYLPLGNAIATKLHDRRRITGLQFHMQFSNLAEVNGWAVDAAHSLAVLPTYLAELPTREVSTLIVERTDVALSALGPVPQALCERLANEGRAQTAIGQAGIWRCAACRALRANDLSAVRDAVDASRSHLGRAPPGRERQTIENYLAMIETMADWRERPTPSQALDQRLDQAITAIQALDPRDRPMLAGLWSIRLDAALERRQRAGEEEARLQRLRDAALTIQTLHYGSVQSFCAFDPAAIHNRATLILQPAR